MIFSNENAKIGGDRMTSDFMKELLSIWHSGRCV